MLVLVPTTRTTCTYQDLIIGLIRGWYSLYKVPPTKQQIGVIYAQNTLETGGTLHMYNWNFGNIKAVDAPSVSVEYCKLNGVWEIINGQRVEIPADNPGAWFRSFPTLDAGIAWYMNFLRNTRYKIAWSAVEAGDPALFSHYLKQQGYYTAPEASYTSAMLTYFGRFMNDVTFDNVLPNIMAQIDNITFPPDYGPVNFDVGDKVFENHDYTNVSGSLFSSWFGKIKGMFSS